jgi:hypothetical protein
MSPDSTEQVKLAQGLSAALAPLDPAAQQAVVKALIPPPTEPVVNQLWLILIGGLSVALLVALIGGVVLVIDGKAADAAVTAFSSLLAGLLGLFAPSPTGQ